MVVVGVVQQGLGGDAAHVEAGAAQGGVLLDADSLQEMEAENEMIF